MTDTDAKTLPLDDVMLAMDVVDTLRHRQDLVARELRGEARADSLIDRLRTIYSDQGIEVPDAILRQGVDALDQSRFTYQPPKAGLGTSLARIYVTRSRWGKWLIAIVAALVIGIGGYQFGYRPYVEGQVAAAERHLTVELPARMDALYDTIYNETKQQTAVRRAEEIRARGRTAAIEGNLAGAEQAVADLEGVRDQLRQEYRIRVVNREGVESGVWTFPDNNTDATNYYIIVEAVDPDNDVLTLPIQNEETSEIENVSMWGVRVPASVYNSVRSDKLDDGIIQQNILGVKQYGYLEVEYVTPVLGGTITRW